MLLVGVLIKLEAKEKGQGRNQWGSEERIRSNGAGVKNFGCIGGVEVRYSSTTLQTGPPDYHIQT